MELKMMLYLINVANLADMSQASVCIRGRLHALQSFTANKHTGSEDTRNKLSKNKKGRVISLFLAYERGSNPRPLAYKQVFVPIYYQNLSSSRFIKI
jgi:hypothetical protein